MRSEEEIRKELERIKYDLTTERNEQEVYWQWQGNIAALEWVLNEQKGAEE